MPKPENTNVLHFHTSARAGPYSIQINSTLGRAGGDKNCLMAPSSDKYCENRPLPLSARLQRTNRNQKISMRARESRCPE